MQPRCWTRAAALFNPRPNRSKAPGRKRRSDQYLFLSLNPLSAHGKSTSYFAVYISIASSPILTVFLYSVDQLTGELLARFVPYRTFIDRNSGHRKSAALPIWFQLPNRLQREHKQFLSQIRQQLLAELLTMQPTTRSRRSPERNRPPLVLLHPL